MQKISPFLWFDHEAEEAVSRYVSLFEDAQITDTTRYQEGSPGPAGEVMTVTFELFGQEFTALNGGPMYTFNESVSFLVRCEDQAEVDRYYDTLVEGGEEQQCGWIRDRWGVTWQIIPNALFDLMSDPDPGRAQRATQAMLQMKKLDIAALQAAADGA